jgi:type II secretory pathway pseudopilin PulG
MTNDGGLMSSSFARRLPRSSSTKTHSSLVIRHSPVRGSGAFTIMELLVVIAIIIGLAAMILGTVGYVQKKGARSRAEAEIAGMSAALESYKADNGAYPSSPATISLTANDSKPTDYWPASLDLYKSISGDLAGDGITAGQKSYMEFKPAMLGRADMTASISGGNKVLYIRDPFGNSYGYSTSKNPDVNPSAAGAAGFNPTFDLWSTANASPPTDQGQWIKNW